METINFLFKKERGRKSKEGKGADENWERSQNSIKRHQGENVATEIENNFNTTSRNNANQIEQKSIQMDLKVDCQLSIDDTALHC